MTCTDSFDNEMVSDTELFAMPVFQPLCWKLRKYIRKHATKAQEIRERLDRRKVGNLSGFLGAMCYFMDGHSLLLHCFCGLFYFAQGSKKGE